MLLAGVLTPNAGGCELRLSDRTADLGPGILAQRSVATASESSKLEGLTPRAEVPMLVPDTLYAKSGHVRIAYQVVGDGPFDLVFVPGFISNLDLAWEDPARAQVWTRLAAFSRLILFDKRGRALRPNRWSANT